MIRVTSLPIREIISERGGAVVEQLRPIWGMSTALANWAIRELAFRDVRRTSRMKTLPAYSRETVFGSVPRNFQRSAVAAKTDADGKVKTEGRPAQKVGDPQEGSLYRLFSDEYPDRTLFDGCAVSARDVLKNVEDIWRNHKEFGRYAVLWLGKARPAIYRFPFPWPIPADKGKTLRLMRAEQNQPFASIPWPDEVEDRVLLRLADGQNHRYQLRRFDWILANIGRLKQGKICGRRAGGRLVGADLKIVADFDTIEGLNGFSAEIKTGAESLWTATMDHRDDPIVVNFDHLRSLQVAHDRWAYRLRQDGAVRDESDRQRQGGSMIRARLDRAKNRLRTESQQAAKRLVDALRRRGVSDVCYDDGDRTFMQREDGRSGLDWTQLRAALCCECEDRGIAFHHLAGEDDGFK